MGVSDRRVFQGTVQSLGLEGCFSTDEPRPSTGPWNQLYRAAIDSSGIDN